MCYDLAHLLLACLWVATGKHLIATLEGSATIWCHFIFLRVPRRCKGPLLDTLSITTNWHTAGSGNNSFQIPAATVTITSLCALPQAPRSQGN